MSDLMQDWFATQYGTEDEEFDYEQYDWMEGWQDEWADFRDFITSQEGNPWEEYGFTGEGLFNTKRGEARRWFKENWNDIEPGEAPEYDPTEYEMSEDGNSLGYYDEDGNWVIVEDYTNINEMLAAAQSAGMDLPTFQQWMQDNNFTMNDLTGSESYQGLEELIALLEDPTRTEQDIADAMEYSATMMGMTIEELNTLLDEQRALMSTDVDDLQGFSDEERAMREREHQAMLVGEEQRAREMISNIQGQTGSAMRAYAMADQELRRINNADIQGRLAMSNDDYQRKLDEQQAGERRFLQMVQMNQASAAQYINLVSNNRSMLLQTYLADINVLQAENQQYLQMYQADAAAMAAVVDNMYKGINAELGLKEAQMNAAEFYFNQEYAEYTAEMDAYLAAVAAEADEEPEGWWARNSDTVLAIGAIAAGALLMLIPGMQGLGIAAGGFAAEALVTAGGMAITGGLNSFFGSFD